MEINVYKEGMEKTLRRDGKIGSRAKSRRKKMNAEELDNRTS